MGKRPKSIIENIVDLSSFLPCWISLLFALFSYHFLHQFADISPGSITNANELGAYAITQFLKTLSYFLQFIIPFAFVMGAIVSLITTQIKYGFLTTLKSLAAAFTILLASVLLIALFAPTAFEKKFSSIRGKDKPVAEQEQTAKAKRDYVFSEQDISNAKKKLLTDQENNTLFEIQLISGRTLFAKNATIKDAEISFESEGGLVVSMNMNEVRKVRRVIQK